MRRNRTLVLTMVIAVVALVLAACAGGSSESAPTPEGSEAQLLAPPDFAEAVKREQRLLINVHTPDEGAIRGTDITIPFDDLRARVNQLPGDRETPLAVYCKSGNMSATAIDTLTDLGYTDLIELRGGMEAWVDSGRNLTGATWD